MPARWAAATAIGAVLLASACASEVHTSTDGACPKPQTKVSTATVTPGQSITVYAADMWDGCNDQGTNSKLPPLTDQVITWNQDGGTAELTKVDADNASGRAEATVTIPSTATTGQAQISLGIAVPATVTVTAG